MTVQARRYYTNVFFTVIIFSLLVSFTNVNAEKIDTATPAIAAHMLYSLTVSANDFKTKLHNKRRAIFIYKIDADGIFTMDGYSSKKRDGRKYDTSKILILNKSAPITPYTLGSTYFANVIIHKRDIKEIFKLLEDKSYLTVIFTPFFKGEKIAYRIDLERKDADTGNKTLLAAATANPSPPHQYADRGND